MNTTKSTLRYILRGMIWQFNNVLNKLLTLIDTNILVLALVSCFFEGSLFLFIFFKFPALKLSHKLVGSKEGTNSMVPHAQSHAKHSTELPFGLIFAILMCSMMLGSMLYNNITTTSTTFPAKRVLMGTLMVASACFFIPGHFRDERITLWCFCMFELCCGIYYPVMASIKGKLIEDGSRASVYTVLRIPLNAFVVLALSTTKEGKENISNLTLYVADFARRITSRCSVYNMQRFVVGSRACCAQDSCMRCDVKGQRELPKIDCQITMFNSTSHHRTVSVTSK